MNIINLYEQKKKKIDLVVIIISFLVLYITFFYKFNLGLLFSDTILTGGDSASWFQTVKNLKENLLPHFRLFGWNQANFFGFNELQYYFPLPFLIAAILGFFMPLTVALKITTFIGLVTLPLAFFYSTKKITKNNLTAISASFLSLIFIFNEFYTMFGGNFLSTFAGEFCYSISLTIAVFFIGVCYETFEKGKNPVFAGILLGLTALSHIFVFMPAFFIPFYFLLADRLFLKEKLDNNLKSKNNKKKKDELEQKLEFCREKIPERILIIYVIAFLLISFWLVPMIFTKKYSQSISMIWTFDSFKDFISKTFMGFILLGFVLALLLMWNFKKLRLLSLLFIYLYAVSLFFYIISLFLEIPDIRFIPFALVVSVFSTAVFSNYFADFLDIKKFSTLINLILTFVIMIIGILFVIFHPKNVTSWYKWNYSGYEAKKEYVNLKGIIREFGGDINTGRILWEKQDQNDNADFGSERAFENLFLFTGRPATEGVHYHSSFMARTTTYMQSEYSLRPVDPEAYRIYSKVNPEVWGLRFFQVNAKDIITFSQEIKDAFSNHPDFEKSGEFGKFSIFTYKYFPKSYVMIYDLDKIKIIKDNKYGFKTDFYRYFRDYELFDTPFIFEKYGKNFITSENYYKNYDEYKDKNFKEYFDFNKWLLNYKYFNSIYDEDVTQFKIKFKTKEIGKPHIIKITYSPNFKSKNGEKIYPISPGFMMIIPEKENVEIYYGTNIYEIIGFILTLLLIPLIIFANKLLKIEIPFKIREIIINTVLVLFFIIVAVLILFSLTGKRAYINDIKVCQNLYNQNKFMELYNKVSKYATIDNLDKYDNSIIYDYYIMKSQALAKLNRKKEAKETIDYIFRRYNHSRLNDNFQWVHNVIR